MSTLSYAWNVHGTFNGDFMSASGTTASVDGIAEVHGTAGEGAPFNHSSWIWGGFGHYGLGYIKGGHKETPTENYPFHMTRHWRGEDGAHIWSSHHVTGAEGAWAGDVDVVAEYFQPEGPICKGLIRGQYPSHWVATKRSDKEAAVVDPNWTWGKIGDKTTFSWHLSGSLNDKAITADGYGYGHGYRQHHWGKGGKGFGEHGLPNLAWALAWEGHAGLHFFTRFPKGVVNPFIYSLPEGFTVEPSGGDRMATTGPPPTTSGMKVLTSTREFSWSTAAIGKWTSTSENPTPRCPTLTWSSSGLRPGLPSLITGTSTRERRLKSLLMTKLQLLKRKSRSCA